MEHIYSNLYKSTQLGGKIHPIIKIDLSFPCRQLWSGCFVAGQSISDQCISNGIHNVIKFALEQNTLLCEDMDVLRIAAI